jgi:aspartate ammonia-lyase
MTRTEMDSLGEVEISADRYWGAQTERALDNFRISEIPTEKFPDLIVALAMVKRAAAFANHTLGLLQAHKWQAIAFACDQLIAGRYHDQFRLDMIQGGAGTSLNMNANEVIANIAIEKLGASKGDYAVIHPNDDVNRSQSTNDVYPTSTRLAILAAYARLQHELTLLIEAFGEKSLEFRDVMKLGRTQLQDAVPMTLGQEFGAFATVLTEDLARGSETSRLLQEVNLGGTAIGTGLNAPHDYQKIAIHELSRLCRLPLRGADDLIEASWDTGALVSMSGMIKRTAIKLSKIASDLRLLSSGPRGGLGEIHLPERQPGSSIMPGKVNPVIPEVVNQACYEIIGNDMTVSMASEAAQLQLNAMEPVMVYNILSSIRILSNSIVTFRERCVRGITAAPARCEEHLERSVSMATALVPAVGYDLSAKLAKDALASGVSLKALAKERFSGFDIDSLLNLRRMT